MVPRANASGIRPPALTPESCGGSHPSSVPWAASCASCSLKGVCLPCSLNTSEVESFSALARLKRRIAHGTSLFRAGESLEALYVIHSGAFKTVSLSRDGNEKVTGFYLPGEMLGLGAISTGTHAYDATALEGSEVCVIPLQRMTYAMLALQQQLFRALSAAISRDHGLMLLLGRMSAEQRLAAFLLSLSRRYRRLGYSPDCFVLRMTRQEIGSYLGLTLETVSRVISRLNRERLVSVHRREVHCWISRPLTQLSASSEWRQRLRLPHVRIA